MRKILYVLLLLALVVIGGFYYHAHELAQENARETAKGRASENNFRASMRQQRLEHAAQSYQRGLQSAKDAMERDRAAGKNALLVEQLYETKLINLRAERDERIKEAEKYAPLAEYP